MELPTLIPIGTINGMEEAYCIDKTSDWYGWLFHKHPDGQWVSWRETGPMERAAVENTVARKVSITSKESHES